MPLEYSTACVEAQRRFDYWNDIVCQHCIPASSQMLGGGHFSGRLSVFSVGETDFSVMAASSHHWERLAHHVRADDSQDLWLAYLHAGHARVEQTGRQAVLSEGDMVLYDATKPFKFTVASERIYLVRLQRAHLLAHCSAIEHFTAQKLNHGRPAVEALRSMLEHASEIQFDPSKITVAQRFGQTLLDLAATALEFLLSDPVSSMSQDAYVRMLGYVKRHLGDPSLSLDAIADAHHVSARTVTRIFARHDQTPMGMVWRLRLQASAQALAEGSSRSVTEVAFNHGFSDVSHFSRAFRRTFGYAPSALVRTKGVQLQ